MAKETSKKKVTTKKTSTKSTAKKTTTKKVDKNINDTKDLIEEARERVLDEDRDILTSRVKKNELNYTQEIVDDIKEDDYVDQEYSRENEAYDDYVEEDDLYDQDERIINDDDASEIIKKIKEMEDSKEIDNHPGDTNLYDFDFDDKRLKDVGSLDTSFVEGKVKSKELKEDLNRADKPIKTHSFGKFIGKVFLCIFFMLLGALLSYLYFRKDINNVKVKEKIVEKEVKVIDKNYVFLGDHVFSNYDLTKYISEDNVVNSSDEDDTSASLLKDIKTRALVYNPSDVFISIGSNDYLKDLTNEEIITNIGGIIDVIKNNRSLSNIYVLSVLPVGNSSKSRNNETISKLNDSIKTLCEENKITYIDLYSSLIDEDGYLNEEYSKDGLNLNEEGYSVVTTELSKYIG